MGPSVRGVEKGFQGVSITPSSEDPCGPLLLRGWSAGQQRHMCHLGEMVGNAECQALPQACQMEVAFHRTPLSCNTPQLRNLLPLSAAPPWWKAASLPKRFERPRWVDHLKSGVQDQPGQHGKTLSLLKIQKLA
ncbi:hypothetical protein AAY473_021674, partial [Plecturocebus cupreus]